MEFQKLPVFDNDDITTYIRIPDFGIADFDNLNKINKKNTIIEFSFKKKGLIYEIKNFSQFSFYGFFLIW